MIRVPHPVLSLLAVAATFAAGAAAQGCATASDTWWQRDRLPQSPQNPTGVSVIQGLDEGESIGVVFEMPTTMAPQLVTQVVAPWGATGGIPGFQALLDLEVYDGVSFAGGVVNMGNLVFSLSQNAAANMQVQSHGLNVLDTSSFGIVVGTAPPNGTPAMRRFAICFTVDINLHPTGSCQTGWAANFFTDNSSFNIFCDPVVTPPRTSLLRYRNGCGGANLGWHDVTTATVSGIPLCGPYYQGIWAIRCCTRDAFPASYSTFGVGCAGTMPVSTLQPVGLPRIGTTMNVIVNNLPDNVCLWLTGFSNTTSPLGPLPFSLGPLGAVGCDLRVSPDSTQLLFANNNVTLTSLALPNVPGLIGLPLYQQALASDTAGNALGAVASDAAAGVVGQ